MYIEETIAKSDLEQLVAAATNYIGNGLYLLRVMGEKGTSVNFVLDAVAFHHLDTMIDNAIVEGLGDLDAD
ncbi:hypothetical protein [Mycobacterium arosiense]|uniref:Uncharacterized protein n=1 Tax=Mycobacterium arosiense ATCC BAA-1401 = DSM 45069 TaxID=1265311 RepID=A0A1W9ZKB4_MYCAI|nr:hypothetical protein [Mycobacterium arosiense]ORA17367.1 hypothetical protein BST14_08830 [Mycobacterium arosiense ATCC BAA-1401 = DSM 45069]